MLKKLPFSLLGVLLLGALVYSVGMVSGASASTISRYVNGRMTLQPQQNTPYQESYRKGYRQGYQDGQADCSTKGFFHKQSQPSGDQGFRDGYGAGYNAGRAACKQKETTSGTKQTYQQSYAKGYSQGFQDGRADCKQKAFHHKKQQLPTGDQGFRDGYSAGYNAGRASC
ncbi:MAG: hypothetical protein J2P37_10560 [Ktedonobacteraceae bacterium]|nr:hypothetical protein [Ktedonobacteraceae bacterium]